MKDFVKWLGVNEKIAKLVVWIFIIMVFLILTNTLLESMGFPNYKITYDNLKELKSLKVIEYIFLYLISILNFYAVVLLVFSAKESKTIFKYALLYLLISAIISCFNADIIAQIFMMIFVLCFCYYYSGKKKKCIVCGFLAYLINAAIQGIWYSYKIKSIDSSTLNDTEKILLTLDYFIIMGIIILVKEIYLKKRSEKYG